MNDRFKRIIANGYNGYTTDDAQAILRNSSEVSLYVEKKREHLKYVQQLMNDRIIDEGLARAREKGQFRADKDGNISYTCHVQPRVRLNEEYPTQYIQKYQTPPQSKDDVMSILDAMEQEMNELRRENQELRSRYNNLK